MAAHTKASAIPVLPLVASTIVVRPGSIAAFRLGGLDHRHADPVLDAAARVVGLELGEERVTPASAALPASSSGSSTIGVSPTSSGNVDRDSPHAPLRARQRQPRGAGGGRSDVVHHAARVATLAIEHVGDRRLREDGARGRGGFGEDALGALAEWAVEQLDDLQDA